MENGTSILFGLPGVAVQRVERALDEHGVAVRLVHVVTTASQRGGLPAVRGDLDVGEAAAHDPAAGSALWRGAAGGAVAQAAVPVPGGGVPAQGVHRVASPRSRRGRG